MASQQITLAPGVKKESANLVAAGFASANVIVEFDDTLNKNQVITTIDLLRARIIEEFK